MEEQNMNTNEGGGMNQEPTGGDEDKASVGPAVGIIIILIVLVVGGFYFFGSFGPGDDAQTDALRDVSESDEVDAIEDDLDSTELEALDEELEGIDAMLDEEEAAL